MFFVKKVEIKKNRKAIRCKKQTLTETHFGDFALAPITHAKKAQT